MTLLNALIDKLQATFPVNRVVILLTPLFVAASAWIAGWVADHFPGLPHLSGGQVTAVMIAAATAALIQGYKWLDGWQKHEAQAGGDATIAAEIEARSQERIAALQAGILPHELDEHIGPALAGPTQEES